ncbi:IS3 family transposase [Secundilactobacillus kimchicus]
MCLDNAATESLFHILKLEVYYQNQFDSLEELKTAITNRVNY